MQFTLAKANTTQKIKNMATYRVTTSGKSIDMEELTTLQQEALKKKNTPVIINLSKGLLNKMRIDAGIVSTASDSTILRSWIVKRINDGTI